MWIHRLIIFSFFHIDLVNFEQQKDFRPSSEELLSFTHTFLCLAAFLIHYLSLSLSLKLLRSIANQLVLRHLFFRFLLACLPIRPLPCPYIGHAVHNIGQIRPIWSKLFLLPFFGQPVQCFHFFWSIAHSPSSSSFSSKFSTFVVNLSSHFSTLSVHCPRLVTRLRTQTLWWFCNLNSLLSKISFRTQSIAVGQCVPSFHVLPTFYLALNLRSNLINPPAIDFFRSTKLPTTNQLAINSCQRSLRWYRNDVCVCVSVNVLRSPVEINFVLSLQMPWFNVSQIRITYVFS